MIKFLRNESEDVNKKEGHNSIRIEFLKVVNFKKNYVHLLEEFFPIILNQLLPNLVYIIQQFFINTRTHENITRKVFYEILMSFFFSIVSSQCPFQEKLKIFIELVSFLIITIWIGRTPFILFFSSLFLLLKIGSSLRKNSLMFRLGMSVKCSIG